MLLLFADFFLDGAGTVPQLSQYLFQILLILGGIGGSFGRIGVYFIFADAGHGVDPIALRLLSEDVVFGIGVMVSEQGRRVFITQMEKVENRLMLDSIDHSLRGNSI